MESDKKYRYFNNKNKKEERNDGGIKQVLMAISTLVFTILFVYFFFGTIRNFTPGKEIIKNLNIVDSIPNDVFLSLISLLVAFGGILSWIFKENVKKNLEKEMRETIGNLTENFDNDILVIKDEIRIIQEDEIIASRIYNGLNTAFTLLSVYQSIYNDDFEKLKSLVNKEKESDFIKNSVSNNKIALETFNNIKEKERYNSLFLKLKNNLSVCLAYSIAPNPNDIKDAEKFSKENYDFIQNNTEIKSPRYIFEATRALVLLRFSKNIEEAEEAEKIYNNLLNSDIPISVKEKINENKEFVKRIKKLKTPSI